MGGPVLRILVALAGFFGALGLGADQPVDLSVSEEFSNSAYALLPEERSSYEFLVEKVPRDAVARNVRLQVELPPGIELLSVAVEYPGWSCNSGNRVVTCVASVFSDFYNVFTLEVTAPDALEGGLLTARALVSSDTPDPDLSNNTATSDRLAFRQYLVTSTADSGPGSLRESLERSNAECDRDGVPCLVRFHIPPPVPKTGQFTIAPSSPFPPIAAAHFLIPPPVPKIRWFTIAPSSPFPPITATYFVLDATSQTAFTGDTNPAGPEIELKGALLEEGNGFEIRPPPARVPNLLRQVTVTGFAINGFPENGILIDDPGQLLVTSFFTVTKNYIGTDPEGVGAVPNGLRGMASFGPGFLTISSNVISGNRRSGIFIDAIGPTIENNRIGVKAATDDPLPNGASGIYFGLGSGFGCVDRNVIANNMDFGIAIERPVPNVWVAQNSIKNNGLFGLDIGLDLESPDRAGPVLTSADFDDARGVTVIRGRFPPPRTSLPDMVDFYSNSTTQAKGEGETWLGTITRETYATDEFVFVYPGNLLNKAVTSTVTRSEYNSPLIVHPAPQSRTGLALCQQQGFEEQTSEFGDPILVTQ